MTDTARIPATAPGRVLAADGTPLKKSIRRALRAQKLRALALVAPLLIFVLVSFVAPIIDMLFRSVENQIVADTLPRTVEALETWDAASGEAPGEDVFAAFYTDMVVAEELKTHTRLGSRLNYETSGISSLFRKTGRLIGRFETDLYADAFGALDAGWREAATWASLMSADDIGEVLPETASAWAGWLDMLSPKGKDPAAERPADFLFAALWRDLTRQPAEAVAAYAGPEAARLAAAAAAAPGIPEVSLRDAFIEADDGWADPGIWATIKAFSPNYTPGYFLAAVDLQKTADGVERQPESQRIYLLLFQRTLFMSLVIMGSCILLGYPIAFILSNLPMRQANLLMILVLLPFWTSLLVRTSAWKVLLQQQGVINDLLVWIGLVADDNRLQMINNQFGTIVAMTHILLPFMILPLYSVMKTIPPTYVRAAKSLGATNWTAFWRVYFPQSVPGIGAGCILVFILSIGYYITPELVGGTSGTFISNRIAYNISSSLNWGLAAALGTILLVAVLLLYWAYDRIVGIDNVSLG